MGSLRADSRRGCWRVGHAGALGRLGPRVLSHAKRRFCYSKEHPSSGIRGKGGTTQRWVIPCRPGDENPSEAGMLQPTPGGTSPWGQRCTVPTATRDLPSPRPPPCQLGATPACTAPTAGSFTALLLPRMLTQAVTPRQRKEVQSRALARARTFLVLLLFLFFF